jgi:L-amino acid N-acyltransferase YncA
VRYRLATAADLDACHELEWTRTRDDLAWHVAGELLYVAESDAGIVGLLRLESFWRTMPYLALITFRADARGNGHGSALLAHVCGELVRRGYRTLLSSTTDGEDGPARWHRKNGFVEAGTLTALNDDGRDEIFWRLALDQPPQKNVS